MKQQEIGYSNEVFSFCFYFLKIYFHPNNAISKIQTKATCDGRI